MVAVHCFAASQSQSLALDYSTWATFALSVHPSSQSTSQANYLPFDKACEPYSRFGRGMVLQDLQFVRYFQQSSGESLSTPLIAMGFHFAFDSLKLLQSFQE